MTAQEALDVARDATSVAVVEIEPDSDFSEGQTVIVRTEDPGADPVTGTLLRLTPRDIVIVRDDPRVGTVAVHFPRIGQVLSAA